MHYANMEMDKFNLHKNSKKAFILTFEKDLATMIFIFFCFFDQSGDDFFKSKTLQTFPSMSATMIRQM